MKLTVFLRSGILVAALCVFGFLALRASPHLKEIPWMPRWLALWADEYGVIRNVPAFAALCLVAIACVDWRFRYHVLGGLCILAAAFEFVQIWLPGRFSGWDDILASWAGVALGYVAACALKWWHHGSRTIAAK